MFNYFDQFNSCKSARSAGPHLLKCKYWIPMLTSQFLLRQCRFGYGCYFEIVIHIDFLYLRMIHFLTKFSPAWMVLEWFDVFCVWIVLFIFFHVIWYDQCVLSSRSSIFRTRYSDGMDWNGHATHDVLICVRWRISLHKIYTYDHYSFGLDCELRCAIKLSAFLYISFCSFSTSCIWWKYVFRTLEVSLIFSSVVCLWFFKLFSPIPFEPQPLHFQVL